MTGCPETLLSIERKAHREEGGVDGLSGDHAVELKVAILRASVRPAGFQGCPETATRSISLQRHYMRLGPKVL